MAPTIDGETILNEIMIHPSFHKHSCDRSDSVSRANKDLWEQSLKQRAQELNSYSWNGYWLLYNLWTIPL